MATTVSINAVAPEPTSTNSVEPNKVTAASLAEMLDQEVKWYTGLLNKGNVSNFLTFLVMIVGIILRITLKDDCDKCGRYTLAFGLFGFAGGITNWLAVKMLFDKIPGVYGSGIIPKQFEQIKTTIKMMIMDTFFEKEFLEKQLAEKLASVSDPKALQAKIHDALESPAFDEILDNKLQEISAQPAGMLLSAVGMTTERIKPFVKKFVVKLGSELGKMFAKVVGSGQINTDFVRNEVDKLMEERLQELSPDRVKKLMELVIREHLGWLIVWGNIFGSMIGLICSLAGAGEHV